jgi:hypothetical protein
MNINFIISTATPFNPNYVIIPAVESFNYTIEKCNNIFFISIDIIKNPYTYTNDYIITPLNDSYICVSAVVKKIAEIKPRQVAFIAYSITKLLIGFWLFPKIAYSAFFIGIVFSEEMKGVVKKVHSITAGIFAGPYYVKIPKCGLVLLFGAVSAKVRAVSIVIATIYIFAELGMHLVDFYPVKEEPKPKDDSKHPLSKSTKPPSQSGKPKNYDLLDQYIQKRSSQISSDQKQRKPSLAIDTQTGRRSSQITLFK